jgi:hypothetical protein
LKNKICLILLVAGLSVFVLKGQYISEVLEYKPAPGQLINTMPWGVPSAATTLVGGVEGNLSLGAFGGYVVFKFDQAVENHPDNPYGVDFIIFGNANSTWSEPGIVSVMKDENGNGLADDTWHELAASDHFFNSTIRSYEVTYTNPGGGIAEDVPWTDNLGGSGYIFANTFYSQPYYPLIDSFPAVGLIQQPYSGTTIVPFVDSSGVFVNSYNRTFGYADNLPRKIAPWTRPDNPYTVEIENAGGDAFDISWAIDTSGNYVDLDIIHFVKVHTGVLADGGLLGELSTDLRGAVDVSPDPSITGETRMVVIKDLPLTIETSTYQLEVAVFENGRYQPDKVVNWTTEMQGASVNGENVLTVTNSGELQLIASLLDAPAISDTVHTIVDLSSFIFSKGSYESAFSIDPNPAKHSFRIAGIEDASITIVNAHGQVVLVDESYSPGEEINIDGLANGLYFVRAANTSGVGVSKLLKY